MTELSNLCGLAQVRAVKKSCHAALVFSQSWVLFKQQAFNATGEDDFLESKKPSVYGPENEIAAVTFFATNSTALTKKQCLCKSAEWRQHGRQSKGL